MKSLFLSGLILLLSNTGHAQGVVGNISSITSTNGYFITSTNPSGDLAQQFCSLAIKFTDITDMLSTIEIIWWLFAAFVAFFFLRLFLKGSPTRASAVFKFVFVACVFLACALVLGWIISAKAIVR